MSTDTDELVCGPSLAEGEYEQESPDEQSTTTTKNSNTHCHSIASLRARLASDVVSNGPYTTFSSPFAPTRHPQSFYTLPLVYCDQTASNRPLASIEHYLHHTLLPLYGNTHTTTSITGSQSTALVAEARQIVAESVGAKITGKASQDVVLFA